MFQPDLKFFILYQIAVTQTAIPQKPGVMVAGKIRIPTRKLNF